MAARDDGASQPAEFVDVISPAWQGLWPLAPGEPLSQSFQAHQPGLCAVELLLAVTPAARGTLAWTLQRDGPSGETIDGQSLACELLTSQRYRRLPCLPQADSAGQRYYLTIVANTGGVAVYASHLSLGGGTAYRQHRPVEGSLALRTFVAGEDARLALQRELEQLLDERARLTQELLLAHQQLQQLHDERATLHERLAGLLARLAPSAAGDGRG